MKLLLLLLLFNISIALDYNYRVIVDKTLLIKSSSQVYFNDLGYWPSSIDLLIDANYLKNDNYVNFRLSLANTNLNINIGNLPENKILNKYLIDGFWKDDIFIFTIKPKLLDLTITTKTIHNVFFCSNLYCPKF